ncbi:hypothetical protein E4U42_007776 [Claviceps africana]|uniref:Uncharacterized protein n=1 Tax=Claviceps africana TaxID=83212 RepID=A0A8K0NEG7_9HYPO|nr:hypothetical protein E4U42_007776 [Claviceps africana]
MFEQMTKMAMMESRDSVTACGLPLPSPILDGLRCIMIHMRSVRDSLVSGRRESSCSYACAQLQLESFFEAMDQIGLVDLPLTEPFGNRSVQDIKDAVGTLQSSSWTRFHQLGNRALTLNCYLHAKLQPMVVKVCHELSGLRLEDYRPEERRRRRRR